MNDVMIERISQSAKALSLDLYARELAANSDRTERLFRRNGASIPF